MARSDLDVCNLAIGKIGGEPLEAIDEDSPLGVFCGLNYGPKRDYLLGLYDWRFANTIALLGRIAPTPPGTPLRNLFKPPSDIVGAVRAFRDGPDAHSRMVRCLISAVGVSSDANQVYAEYTALAPEAAWPSWFVELAATAFAADLARRRPDADLANALQVEAFGTPEQNGEGGKYLTARQADSRNAPQRQLFAYDAGELVEARMGYGALPYAGRLVFVDTGAGS
jgi:hypothetical protein